MLNASRKRRATYCVATFTQRARNALECREELTDPPDIARNPIMTNSKEFLSKLRTAAWTTSSARFNASRRLRRRDWFATFSIAIFSAIGIVLAIVQKTYAFQIGTPIDNYVTALSVSIGLFVIVISLIEWGTSNSVRADALFRSADELNNFQRKVEQALACIADGQPFTMKDVDDLRLEYEATKARCPFNHEPIDHDLFLSKHRFSPEYLTAEKKPGMCWLRAQWVAFLSFLSIVWYFGLFWIVLALLLWITPWPRV